MDQDTKVLWLPVIIVAVFVLCLLFVAPVINAGVTWIQNLFKF